MLVQITRYLPVLFALSFSLLLIIVSGKGCGKTQKRKRSAGKEKAAEGPINYDMEEVKENLVIAYPQFNNEYATFNGSWLEVYRRQMQKMEEKSQGCKKLVDMKLTNEQIKDFVSSPKARLFSSTGQYENYDFKTAAFGGGCHPLQKLGGNVGSVDTFGNCLRLFTTKGGLSRAIYPKKGISYQISDSESFKVFSVGPCVEEEFHNSFFKDQSVSKRISPSPKYFPDQVEFSSKIKLREGTKFPHSTFESTSLALGPNNRLQYIHASIQKKDLPDFSPSSSFAHTNSSYFEESLEKKENDVLGFAIPSNLGGPTNETFNIFPQSLSSQKKWTELTSGIPQYFTNGWKQVDIHLNFNYLDDTKTRPVSFYFYTLFIQGGKGSIHVNYGRVLN